MGCCGGGPIKFNGPGDWRASCGRHSQGEGGRHSGLAAVWAAHMNRCCWAGKRGTHKFSIRALFFKPATRVEILMGIKL